MTGQLPLYVGIDAGGSKTALVARRGDEPEYRATGPGANLQRLGLRKTAAVLAARVRDAVDAFCGSENVVACAGLAGAGRPEDSAAVSSHWGRLLPENMKAQLAVVHDGEVALEGALAGQSGAVLIAGTGSLVLLRTRSGSLVRAGGWGYLLGDEGSGYAVGLSGLRVVAAEHDGGPATALTELLAQEQGLRTRDDLIRAVYRRRLPVQSLAPLVCRAADRGDALCRDILASQAAALVRQLTWIASGDVEPRVALIGGFIRDRTYHTVLRAAVRQGLPDWEIVEPASDPAEGALRLAMKLPVPPAQTPGR